MYSEQQPVEFIGPPGAPAPRAGVVEHLVVETGTDGAEWLKGYIVRFPDGTVRECTGEQLQPAPG